MVRQSKQIGAVVLRLLVMALLLARPQMGSAAGTWSVLSLPQQPGEMLSPTALAVDAAGNLYVADGLNASMRIEKRDTQGNWSILAAQGATALAVDPAGDLYVAAGNLQERDTRGNWSVTAPPAMLPARSLRRRRSRRMRRATSTWPILPGSEKRDAKGSWSLVATEGASALAVDGVGNLYAGNAVNNGQIRKRDLQGNWSVLATSGTALGQIVSPTALAVDGAGRLYVSDQWPARNLAGRVQRRDEQGTGRSLPRSAQRREHAAAGLAVDGAGDLFIADQSNYGQLQGAGRRWELVADRLGTDRARPGGLPGRRHGGFRWATCMWPTSPHPAMAWAASRSEIPREAGR